MFLIILILALILFEILFYIVGNKTYKTLSLFASIKKKTFIIVFFVLSNSFIIYMALRQYIPIKLHKPIAYFTGYCISIFIYLLIYFIIASILNLILKKIKTYFYV